MSVAVAVSPESAQETAGQPVRILIADDHEVMRLGIRHLLESVSSWSVYAEARSGREAVDIALLSSPDVVIMDITMPEMNGLEAAARIAAERPDIPVILFSLYLSENILNQLKTASVRGAVAKSEAARDLLQAVRTVLSGGTFFPVKQPQAS